MTNGINTGRANLADWDLAQPDNFFVADRHLQRALAFYLGDERYRAEAGRLYRFGHAIATVGDRAVRMANVEGNLPRLESYDGFGRRVDRVIFHPSHHEAGRIIYGSGVMEVLARPGQNLLSLALFYLSAMNGEAGHNCPLACTAGAIKALQAVGSPELQVAYLPHLLNPDYDQNYTAAQFLTEVQGGSDVGANATLAMPLASGRWLLNGEKWFCSNVNAQIALVTARVAGQGEGTRGLGLFLVPRALDNHSLNGLFVRRLKDKFGTRSMATGEVVFEEALAYQVGDTAEGFRTVMNYVINISRIFNAFGCAGNGRRAYLVAWSYAQYRQAFGRPILHYPLIQDSLSKMRSDQAAMLAGSLRIARLLDEVESGRSNDTDSLRLALNLNKIRTASLAHEIIMRAIEILGGNGTIETFSILPRLLRDNVVYENWEGSPNVLLAQAQRDMRRHQLHQPFLALIRTMFEPVTFPRLRREGLAKLDAIAEELEAVLALDEMSATILFRPLMERLTDLFYLACLTVEAGWELFKYEDRTKQRLAEFFLDRRVVGREAKDIPDYLDQVSRLCADVRPGKVEKLVQDETD